MSSRLRIALSARDGVSVESPGISPVLSPPGEDIQDGRRSSPHRGRSNRDIARFTTGLDSKTEELSLMDHSSRRRLPSTSTSRSPAFSDDSVDDSSSPAGVPWSPAAEFLASFSDATTRRRALQTDEEGVEVAGYVLGRTLGEGSFSVVREATELETGERVAVKIVRHYPKGTQGGGSSDSLRRRTLSGSGPFQSKASPSEAEADEAHVRAFLEREIAVWSRLTPHPHIVPLLKLHSNSDASYIFMPLLRAGNLLQFINDFGSRGRRRASEPGSRRSGPRRIGPGTASSATSSGGGAFGAGGLDLVHAKLVFSQIVEGIRYLHVDAHVTHNDIKLENILLDDEGHFRIADFGLAEWRGRPSESDMASAGDWGSRSMELPRPPPALASDAPSDGPFSFPDAHGGGAPSPARLPRVGSTLSSTSSTVTVAGSLQYCPPEQVRAASSSSEAGGDDDDVLDPAVDIWALGCVLYALLEGRLPFDDRYEPRLRVRILRADWDIPAALQASTTSRSQTTHHARGLDGRDPELEDEERERALEVLKGCLEPDRRRRWTIQDVVDSRWLTGSTRDDEDEEEGEGEPASLPGRWRRRPSGSKSRSKERSRSKSNQRQQHHPPRQASTSRSRSPGAGPAALYRSFGRQRPPSEDRSSSSRGKSKSLSRDGGQSSQSRVPSVQRGWHAEG
jgi:serine/threonine protein kinase